MALPWSRMDDFLLKCGGNRDYEQFSKEVLNQIGTLIPYDQGRLYFLDDNGHVFREYLIGVNQDVVSEYHQYFSQLDNRRFSIAAKADLFSRKYPDVEQCVMDECSYGPDSEFFSKYVHPNHIRHSFGLGLRDTGHSLKCLFSLDRTSKAPYSGEEIAIMKHIRPHLDNLFQNLYVQPPDSHGRTELPGLSDTPLTRREMEVADLLIEGVLPPNISKKLCISITTVNKHIANMHAKLHVSTRQELLLKLIRMKYIEK